MKKSLFLTVIILLLLHSWSSAQQSVPDCADRKDKLLLLKKSTNKLESFKTGDGVVEGGDTTYQSSFELCGKKAVIIKQKYSIMLKIEFKSDDYSSDVYAFRNMKNKLLSTLKEIFTGWKTETTKDEDDDGKSELNYFLDAADNALEAKTYVLLNSYIMSDARLFSLEVEWKR